MSSKQPITGEIGPGLLLTFEAVRRRTGIGREQLTMARNSGIVKAYPCGRTHYYQSDEIMQWIVSGGGDTRAERAKAKFPQAPKPKVAKPSDTATLSPLEFAKRLGVDVHKVHCWIHSGALQAINVALKPTGRPRYRIEMEAVERSNGRAIPQLPRLHQRRSRKGGDDRRTCVTS